MKKLLLSAAVVAFGLSNAQIAKGTVYVSGQVGYSQFEDNNNDSKDESFRVIPTVGYFVAPNLAIGTGVGFGSNKYTRTNTTTSGPLTTVSVNENKESAFIVSPFVRKYWTLSDKLFIFGQLEVPMEFGKYRSEDNSTTTGSGNTVTSSVSSETKYTAVGVNVKPGLDYFLNKNWTIEATIGEFGYQTYKLDAPGAENQNNFNFGMNLSSVSIGVKYVFTK